ncbi:MAG TPA: PCYCGC motif-containing (lipo)protein [Gemmatimonadales bacterium]|nr:PCYCGC motif-containing (lipo)protein [Gemmatimonadales bacterium]
MTRAPWLIAGAAGVALVALVALKRPADASIHPAPRPGITAAKVMPASLVPRTPGSAEAYAAARVAAGTLDGVYCHCDCSKHAGHRSLLTCFETDHGAYCDVCMGEAMLAAGMAQQGRSLMEIRGAIDRQFGS